MKQFPDLTVEKDKTIGILGGGQLARMLAAAAGRLGFHTIILDPVEGCPAVQFANAQIVAEYDDTTALRALAEHCAVITYEFENIPASSVKLLESICKIYPGSKALEISQDRLVEKQFVRSAGLTTADFAAVNSVAELEQACGSIGLPAILKTRRMGYDGKGQIRLDKQAQVATCELAILETGCILEAKIDFQCEISVIGSRGIDGDTRCYDPARNAHKDGILVSSTVPCNLPAAIVEDAKRQTLELMRRMEYVGVIGVEFFLTNSGQLLINEFAPRVHNSGHWTEAACLISQFEQHIRAITGLPLGPTNRHSNCFMENLLGDAIDRLDKFAADPACLIHSYGKRETRKGRKMGHVTSISKLN